MVVLSDNISKPERLPAACTLLPPACLLTISDGPAQFYFGSPSIKSPYNPFVRLSLPIPNTTRIYFQPALLSIIPTARITVNTFRVVLFLTLQ